MATEIVTLKVIDSFTPQSLDNAIDFLRPPPPGLRSHGWGRTAEDLNTVIWILNWDSVKAHESFMKSSVYPAFVAAVTPFCTASISLFHTYLQPFPSAEIFQAGVLEVTITARRPDVSLDLLEAVNRNLLELTQKAPGYCSHFQGVKHEDNNVYIYLVVWESMESVESHDATLSSEARAAAADLIVSEASYVHHVKLQLQ